MVTAQFLHLEHDWFAISPARGGSYGDEGVAKALIGGRSQGHAALARAGREPAESREPAPTC
jgi:hypothetical protein